MLKKQKNMYNYVAINVENKCYSSVRDSETVCKQKLFMKLIITTCFTHFTLANIWK